MYYLPSVRQGRNFTSYESSKLGAVAMNPGIHDMTIAQDMQVRNPGIGAQGRIRRPDSPSKHGRRKLATQREMVSLKMRASETWKRRRFFCQRRKGAMIEFHRSASDNMEDLVVLGRERYSRDYTVAYGLGSESSQEKPQKHTTGAFTIPLLDPSSKVDC
ncbi:hypothetical protein B0H34DRAFT_676670 [Crassisporium funariophilum]|nr:hypothetical protein B0H34DRAFT_676670 [Crassisporium funariophilum]